jgi:hypothetical protein
LSEQEEKVIEFVSKKLANGKRIQELQLLKRMLTYVKGTAQIGLFSGLSEDMKHYGKEISQNQKKNIVNIMTNEFPAGTGRRRIRNAFSLRKMETIISRQNLSQRWQCTKSFTVFLMN